MILLSSCRDMAISAKEETRGLLLTMSSWRNNYNLLQNDNGQFLVPKQSFGLEIYIYFFFLNADDNKIGITSAGLSSPCRLYD